MDTYTPAMAARFRENLLSRAQQLGALLRQDAQAAGEGGPHDVGDFKDVAAEESIANVDNAQAAQAAAELAQVQAALRRIADGSYGQCLDCGDPIDLRRLLALPATPYCASCQTAREREH